MSNNIIEAYPVNDNVVIGSAAEDCEKIYERFRRKIREKDNIIDKLEAKLYDCEKKNKTNIKVIAGRWKGMELYEAFDNIIKNDGPDYPLSDWCTRGVLESKDVKKAQELAKEYISHKNIKYTAYTKDWVYLPQTSAFPGENHYPTQKSIEQGKKNTLEQGEGGFDWARGRAWIRSHTKEEILADASNKGSKYQDAIKHNDTVYIVPGIDIKLLVDKSKEGYSIFFENSNDEKLFLELGGLQNNGSSKKKKKKKAGLKNNKSKKKSKKKKSKKIKKSKRRNKSKRRKKSKNNLKLKL